jgi:hypothetical protein
MAVEKGNLLAVQLVEWKESLLVARMELLSVVKRGNQRDMHLVDRSAELWATKTVDWTVAKKAVKSVDLMGQNSVEWWARNLAA